MKLLCKWFGHWMKWKKNKIPYSYKWISRCRFCNGKGAYSYAEEKPMNYIIEIRR